MYQKFTFNRMQNILDITSNNAINSFKNRPTKEFYDSALDRWISVNSIGIKPT